MRRVLVFGYGLVSYLLFFAIFLYSIGFIGNLLVPKSIDSGVAAGSPLAAVLVNLGLLSVFALQHSVMARPAFKRWWTRIIPEPIERSTYVLASVAALALIYWLWQPLPALVWSAESAFARGALTGLYFAGWALVLYATILISHFDLFGLRQVWLELRGRVYAHLPFDTPSLYRFLRHPLYLGWFIVFWAGPDMSVGRLLFAATCTAYILVAVQLEERDLVAHLGERYARYREQVPAFLPRLRRRAGARLAASETRAQASAG